MACRNTASRRTEAATTGAPSPPPRPALPRPGRRERRNSSKRIQKPSAHRPSRRLTKGNLIDILRFSITQRVAEKRRESESKCCVVFGAPAGARPQSSLHPPGGFKTADTMGAPNAMAVASGRRPALQLTALVLFAAVATSQVQAQGEKETGIAVDGYLHLAQQTDRTKIQEAKTLCPKIWESFVARCDVFANKKQKSCDDTTPKPDDFGYCKKLHTVENMKCLLRAESALIVDCAKTQNTPTTKP